MGASIAKPEELEMLRPLIGKSLVFTITDKSEEWVGNLDEGEDYSFHEQPTTVQGVLKQIYISQQKEHGQMQVFFRVGLPDGEALIPGRYWGISRWEVARQREDKSAALTGIYANGESEYAFKNTSFASTFGGCELYCKRDNAKEENKIPSLSQRGCRYDSSSHAIRGDIEKLLVDCRPVL